MRMRAEGVLLLVRSLHAARLLLLLGLATGTTACKSDNAPVAHACLPALPADCTPLYDPTFDNLYKNVLGTTCGASTTGSSCHSERGAMAGLVMQTANEAYDHLLGKTDGRKRVIPGNPECSLLMERLASDDPRFRMPPGQMQLSAMERCAFQLWISEGANR
jgi:hypothetical protein